MSEFILRNQFSFDTLEQVSLFSLLQDQVQMLFSLKTREQRDQMPVCRNRDKDLHTHMHGECLYTGGKARRDLQFDLGK